MTKPKAKAPAAPKTTARPPRKSSSVAGTESNATGEVAEGAPVATPEPVPEYAPGIRDGSPVKVLAGMYGGQRGVVVAKGAADSGELLVRVHGRLVIPEPVANLAPSELPVA